MKTLFRVLMLSCSMVFACSMVCAQQPDNPDQTSIAIDSLYLVRSPKPTTKAPTLYQADSTILGIDGNILLRDRYCGAMNPFTYMYFNSVDEGSYIVGGQGTELRLGTKFSYNIEFYPAQKLRFEIRTDSAVKVYGAIEVTDAPTTRTNLGVPAIGDTASMEARKMDKSKLRDSVNAVINHARPVLMYQAKITAVDLEDDTVAYAGAYNATGATATWSIDNDEVVLALGAAISGSTDSIYVTFGGSICSAKGYWYVSTIVSTTEIRVSGWKDKDTKEGVLICIQNLTVKIEALKP